jgi:hypothetical protein
MTSPGTQPASKRLVTEERANATYAPVSRALPTGGTAGQVPVKTASGVAWQTPASGGGGVQSTQVGRIVAVPEGDPLPTLSDGDLVIRYVAPTQPGAAYFYDFTTDTVNAAPAGWTSVWDEATWTVTEDAEGSGGRILLCHTTATRGALMCNAVDSDPDRADVEVLFRHRTPADTSASIGGAARVSGDGTSENGYRGGQLSGTQVTLHKYINAAATQLGLLSATATSSTWYMCRFRINGSTLQLKSWVDGTAEPAAWQLTATDTSITAAGKVGLIIGSGAGKRVDWIAIATGGRTAVKP